MKIWPDIPRITLDYPVKERGCAYQSILSVVPKGGWGTAAFNLQPPEEPEDELGTQSVQERESFQEPSFSPGPYFPKCDRWNFTFEVFVQIVGNIQNSPWELGIQIPLVGGEVIWVSRGQNKETWTALPQHLTLGPRPPRNYGRRLRTARGLPHSLGTELPLTRAAPRAGHQDKRQGHELTATACLQPTP